MGDPKKPKKKYATPSHPWQKERIVAEQELSKKYGLRRKFEIWKMNSILKNYTTQAKNLITVKNDQVAKERAQLLAKLNRLGLIDKDAKVEDILSLGVTDVMNRRLQTLVFKKELAHSLKQARQFITHNHIMVGGKQVTSPAYLVPVDEESTITFVEKSSLASEDHPERSAGKKETMPKKPEAEEKPAEEKAEAPKEEAKAEEKAEEKPVEVAAQ